MKNSKEIVKASENQGLPSDQIEEKKAKCDNCKYCKFPRTSIDNWGACKCKLMKYKTIDVWVSGGETPSWCPLNQTSEKNI